jgi:Winged helix DNA-binding domain
VAAAREPAPLAERLQAQLLSGPPANGPAEVVERLLAVQGQDPRGLRLAVRARSTIESADEVDRALSEERSLVVTWLNRGTLHLVRREDYPWLQALIAPRWLTANSRRLAQEGIDPAAADRGVAALERALAAEGPLTRDELGDRVAHSGVRSEGQALVHLLFRACLRGVAVRGPMKGRHHAYVLVREWLGEPRAVDRDAALADLARRYLAGHGPADDRDLAKWTGLPLRDVRAGLGAIGGELNERPDGLVELAGRPPVSELPVPKLLGAFEPVLLGWRSREALVGRHTDAVISGGIFRPAVLVKGRVAGTWALRGDKLTLTRLSRIGAADAAALDVECEAVLRFLGPGQPTRLTRATKPGSPRRGGR